MSLTSYSRFRPARELVYLWVVGIRTHSRGTLLSPATKDCREKCRPNNYALRVPIICVVNKAAAKLAKNAQTVLAENPFFTTQIMACYKGV